MVYLASSSGTALTGQQVDWTVSGGNGAALGSATSNSNSIGIASNTLILGSVAGTYTVTATIHGTTISTTFTATAIGYPIVTSGLIANFDAAYANGGTAPYSSGCGGSQLTWTDRVAGLTGSLVNYGSCGATSGWNGTGTSSDPYRMNFDRTSAVVDIGSPASFPSGTSPRSMCVWAELDSNTGGYTVAVGYGSTVNSQAMYLGTKWDGLGLNGGGYTNNVYSPGNFWNPGEWNHVCLTYDGTTANLYANGALVTTQAISWSLVKSVGYIGGSVTGTGSGENWLGGVASFMMYNRVLSLAEVSQNCKALVSRFQGVTCN